MSNSPKPQEGISMMFDVPVLHDPRLRELFDLAHATAAQMNGNSSEESSENAGAETPQEGEHGEQENGENQDGSNEGENKEKPSWNDWLSALPDDQQAMVRAEIERRERDTRKARQEARNLRTRAQEAEAKAAEKGQQAESKEGDVNRFAEQSNVLREENQGLRQRLVRQEIRVQAASLFADPDDPAELLANQVADLMDDDLEPDSQAISDALKELLERKPHLAKPTESKPRPPKPTQAQGSSGSSPSNPGSKGAAEAARRFGNAKPAGLFQKAS